MNSSNYEMATPINSLQQQQQPTNNNINNLVRNVENNIETLGNARQPQPQLNLTYNPNPEAQYVQPTMVQNYQPVQQPRIVKQEIMEEPVKEEKKSLYQTILVNSKEYLIMILLFSLLAHKKINRLFVGYIPGLASFDSPIPSLIIRGVVFTVLSVLVKNFV